MQPPTNSNAGDGEAIYPIRQVSEETGVNSITLRAWERRYGFIKPKRTEKGHRLYTRADIEQVKRVVEMLEQGSSLTGVKAALAGASAGADTENKEDNRDVWQGYLKRMQEAISGFDEGQLEAAYGEAMSLYPVQVVMTRILLPLLRQLGQRWQEGRGMVAEEHFFGVYLRNKLGARLHHGHNPARGPKLVAACVPGEYHDFGLLLFSLVARERGFRLVLLGANTPLEDLPEVVARTGAKGIVLSASVKPATKVLDQQLPQLATAVAVPVFIGGSGLAESGGGLEKAGLIVVGSELAEGARRIYQHLQGSDL